MKKLFYFSIALMMIITSCEESTDKPDGKTITGEIKTPTVWTADKEWVIEGTVSVTSDLVIEPGTIVKFKPDAELAIGYGAYGSLKAIGTAEKPIVFTSATSNPTAGNYRGITFWENAASTSKLSWCTIEYAGNSNGYSAALYIYKSSVSVNNCNIRKSAAAGIVNYDGSFGNFSVNTIAECNGYVMEIPASKVHLIDAASTFVGKGILINNANLTTHNVTWQTLSVPYVTSQLSIYDNGSLTLSAGLQILFLADGWLSVGHGSYGKIVTQGTAEKPVVLSSATANPTAGNWRGLEFFASAGQHSSLTHTIVEYAGNSGGYSAAVYLYECGISMTNSIIRKSATHGIYLYNARLLSFENNTIEQCADYPVSIPANSVHKIAANNQISGKGVFVNMGDLNNQSVTWQKLTVPYHLDHLFVYDNGELTVAAGVSMLFRAGGYISVGNSSYGKLIANGTVSMPIIFSSSASSPSPGDWRGMEFFEYTVNGTILNYCKVLYGGESSGYGANIFSYENAGKLSVTNCEIGYSLAAGIYASGCNPSISNIIYTQNSINFKKD
jgi:hypothetical protein